ncbi:MAG: DNA polymerase III subunit gamma/tau [Pseudomonadota bacterium]
MTDPTPVSEKQAAYRVLARKYRPSDFSALIGQEPMVQTLKNAFEAGRIAQAWMLTGVRGVGKTTTARILARALNYKRDAVDAPSIDLEQLGEHCAAIMEGRHVDIVEMDAASHTGIDDIKQIIDGVRYAPVSARYKVYIIDEIHMLSEKAFNALLKTLEEPPPHAKFIFATTEIRKVPITVLSRCQRFDLRRVEADILAKHLANIAEKEEVKIDEASLAMIARAGEGSVRDALSILDQAIAHTNANVDEHSVRTMLGLADRGQVVRLFEKIMVGDMVATLEAFKSLYDQGADPAVILSDLAQFTHLVTRLRFVPQAAQIDASLTPEERDMGLQFSQKLSVQTLGRAWQILLKGIAETETAARPFAAAEMVLIRLAHAADLPTLDQAIKQLETLKQSPEFGAAPSGVTGGAGTNMSAGTAQPQMASTEPGDTAPTMRLVSNGPVATPTPIVSTPEPEPAQKAPQVAINSLQDVIALCDKNRDPLMKANIRQYVLPAAIEPGRLTVGLTEGAPQSLLGDLSKKLQDWTGDRWMISLARDAEGQTLAQQEEAKKQALVSDASRDPEVAKILEKFPGAKVVNVRLADADAIEGEFPMADGAEDVLDPSDDD